MRDQTIVLPLFIGLAAAAPLAYGICQAGCVAVVMDCYAAVSATLGATQRASAAPTVVACNLAFGKCQAACSIAGFFPSA